MYEFVRFIKPNLKHKYYKLTARWNNSRNGEILYNGLETVILEVLYCNIWSLPPFDRIITRAYR